MIADFPSPDCSGNPFMQRSEIKDCNGKRETAPEKP